VNFWQFLDAVHNLTLNWNEMAADRPRKPASKNLHRPMKFSALNVFMAHGVYCQYLHQLLTDFSFFFTGALSEQFAIM